MIDRPVYTSDDHAPAERRASGWPERIGRSVTIARDALAARRLAFTPRERIEALRDERLRAFVQYACDSVPFYRDLFDRAGLAPGDIRTLADLARLPVATDADMRADPARFISARADLTHCIQLISSGSSGINKPVWHDDASVMSNVIYGERQKVVHGRFAPRRPRQRHLTVGYVGSGTAPRLTRIHRDWFPLFKWIGPERRRMLGDSPPERQIEEMNAFRPEIISGMIRGVAEIFNQARRLGLDVHRPRLAFGGGESLPREMRRLLEEEFGIPVIMHYQCTEALKIGFECEARDGYHLHEDICPVRIVDAAGRDLPPGTTGRVVITNLANRASVILNYDLGDRGALIDAPCGCGRTLRRLRLEETRSAPLLRTPEGVAIHYHQLARTLRRYEGIEIYQLLIDAPDRWRVGLVMRDPAARPAWLEEAARALEREVTGPCVRFEVKVLDRPALSPGGKVLSVIIAPGSRAAVTGDGAGDGE